MALDTSRLWAVYLIFAVRALWNLTLFLPARLRVHKKTGVVLGLNLLFVDFVARYLDTVDARVVKDYAGVSNDSYQALDKAFDGLYYVAVIIFILGWGNRHLWYASRVLPWFIFRVVGDVVFVAVGNRRFLIIFPDVPATLWVVIIVADLLRLDRVFRPWWPQWNILSAVSLVVQIFRELSHHYYDPSKDETFRTISVVLQTLFYGALLLYASIVRPPHVRHSRTRRLRGGISDGPHVRRKD